MKKIAVLLALIACSHFPYQGLCQTSSYWQQFLDGQSESITDFSYAGYYFGEANLPSLAELPIFKVEDYGAIPGDEKSDLSAINKAIAAAEAAKGGVILFETGTYLIQEAQDNGERIMISSSKIVLKGQGSGKDGTTLFMRMPLEPADPKKLWSIPAMIEFKGKNASRSIGTLSKSVRIGSYEMTFSKAHGLKPGDIVKISSQGTFLNERMLYGKGTRDKWTNINEKGPYVNELNQVAKVKGKTVIFRAPLLLDMNPGEEWEIEKVSLLANCGFEDIRFAGNFQEEFVHHKNALHDGGYTGVSMTRTINSWVDNCVFVDVSRAVSFGSSLCGTILNCEVHGNGGHGSFGMSRSSRGLIAYCADSANQWHGPNSSHGSVGTVVLGFDGLNRGIDLHAAFPRFTLFDDCEMAGFDGDSVGRASHGGNYINLPNHLEGLVFWNFKQTDRPRPDFNFWDLMEDTPNDLYGPLTAIDPILVGYQGKGTSFVPENVGGIESWGKRVDPHSLYLAQLKARGKEIPHHLAEQEKGRRNQ